MPGIGLDISREIPSPNFGEVGCYGCWDGGENGYAGGEAVAAAVGEVVCCERGYVSSSFLPQKKEEGKC